jgi:hypothetical protein
MLLRAGLEMAGQRLAQLVMYAELEGVICSGPRREKRFTYALLADRAPNAVRLPCDEALATLVTRFLRSHGPATVRDFVWWSGLTTAEAKRALDIVKARREDIGAHTYWTVAPARKGKGRGRPVHLLPIYDEYLVAYRDRHAIPHGPPVVTSRTLGPVTFQHAIVAGGQVAGTWRVRREPAAIRVHAVPLRRLDAEERRSLADAARRFERFSELPVQLVVG